MTGTIGPNVTSIPNYLLYNSTKINSLTYSGSSTQWNLLAKGINWKNGIAATKISCDDIDVDLE